MNLLTHFFVPTWLLVLIETFFLTRPRHFRCAESQAQKGFVLSWPRERGERLPRGGAAEIKRAAAPQESEKSRGLDPRGSLSNCPPLPRHREGPPATHRQGAGGSGGGGAGGQPGQAQPSRPGPPWHSGVCHSRPCWWQEPCPSHGEPGPREASPLLRTHTRGQELRSHPGRLTYAPSRNPRRPRLGRGQRPPKATSATHLPRCF